MGNNMLAASHILIPISDSNAGGAGDSGSHWSLLVICPADGLALHYDSITDEHGRLKFSNDAHAHLVCSMVEGVLGTQLHFVAMTSTPGQEYESNDCGIYVCVLMRHLLFGRILQAQTDEKINMDLRRLQVNGPAARRRILTVVLELICKARRRQLEASPGSDPQMPQINIRELREPVRK